MSSITISRTKFDRADESAGTVSLGSIELIAVRRLLTRIWCPGGHAKIREAEYDPLADASGSVPVLRARNRSRQRAGRTPPPLINASSKSVHMRLAQTETLWYLGC